MALTAKKVYAILKRQISDMEAKLNSPVRYRGTVATADLLPLNPDIGDMYNIESKSIYGEAGMNVAWNGVVWDTMGAPIDMSLYLTKEEAEAVIQRLVTEYFEKNPVKPGATTEQAQQIEQNKTDIASLKTDVVKVNKAIETNSKEDDKNKRKLDALWDLNRGVSYQFESDSEKAYQKKVPSGAKLMSITNIGGNTIESNGEFIDTKVDRIEIIGRNLFDENQKPQDITTPNGIRKGIIVGKGLGEVFASANNDGKYDVYYYLCCIKSDGSFRKPIDYFILKDGVSCGSFHVESDEELIIYSAASSGTLNKIKNMKVQIEKGTVQTEYTPYFKDSIFVPESIKKMNGYGISAGSINNTLDFENMRFVERIGMLDLGQLTWYKFPDENKKIFYAELSGAINASRILLFTKYNLTGDPFENDKVAKILGNILYIQDSDFMTESDFSSSVSGMKMYYEYINEVITDISNEIEKLNTSLIQTKDGTTISFINDRKDDTPVYSSIEYITSLSEVNA